MYMSGLHLLIATISTAVAEPPIASFLDRLELVAHRPLVFIAFILLVAAWVFIVWVGRLNRHLAQVEGVYKKDRLTAIQMILLGFPKELTQAHERILQSRLKATTWIVSLIAILIFLAVAAGLVVHAWTMPDEEVLRQLGRIGQAAEDIKDGVTEANKKLDELLAKKQADEAFASKPLTPEERAIIEQAKQFEDAKTKAKVAILERNFPEADRQLETLAQQEKEIFTKAFDLLVLKGHRYYFEGRFADALEPFEKAYALRPDNIQAS